jgi:hypothetical protein
MLAINKMTHFVSYKLSRPPFTYRSCGDRHDIKVEVILLIVVVVIVVKLVVVDAVVKIKLVVLVFVILV